MLPRDPRSHISAAASYSCGRKLAAIKLSICCSGVHARPLASRPFKQPGTFRCPRIRLRVSELSFFDSRRQQHVLLAAIHRSGNNRPYVRRSARLLIARRSVVDATHGLQSFLSFKTALTHASIAARGETVVTFVESDGVPHIYRRSGTVWSEDANALGKSRGRRHLDHEWRR